MHDPNYEMIKMFAIAFDCSRLIITTYLRLSAEKLKKDQLMLKKNNIDSNDLKFSKMTKFSNDVKPPKIGLK